MARVIIVVLMVSFAGGASYLSYRGVWGESYGLERSVRVGSSSGRYGSDLVK